MVFRDFRVSLQREKEKDDESRGRKNCGEVSNLGMAQASLKYTYWNSSFGQINVLTFELILPTPDPSSCPGLLPSSGRTRTAKMVRRNKTKQN